MKLFLSVLLMVLSQLAFAKDGYRIALQMKGSGIVDSTVYLASYYGEPLPKIYIADSGRFDKDGKVMFEDDKPIVGGIYMVLLSDMRTYFEVLLNNGVDIGITATRETLPMGVVYERSPENERFQEYVIYLQNHSSQLQVISEKITKAKTKNDSANLVAKRAEIANELRVYRVEYIKKYPGTLLANIFGALFAPEVPGGKHLLPNGKPDSNFAYNYYKAHYWDGFDFKDDRLMYTPIYDPKLSAYFNRVVPPLPDSVAKEGDVLLEKTRGQKELFKYTLHWVTKFAQESKVMGMDEAFVHFVENYHMKGDAYWMDRDLLEKYIDKARKIAPNVLGNLAPEIKMRDMDNNPVNLHSVPAKYTLLVFWSPDCGGCQKEIPILDSLYKAEWKAKGVKVFAVRTEGDLGQWKSFVEKHNISPDWIQAYDPEHKSDYRAQYDVYGTPSIYLLDEKKMIRGKRLDHTSIPKVIEIEELKSKKS